MERHNTKILKTILTVSIVLVFVFFTFGSFLLPSVLKIIGVNSSLSGLASFIAFPVGCIGIFAIVVLSLVVHFRQKAHRREDLQKLARQNNWTYTESMTMPFLREFDSQINDSWLSGSNVLTGSSNNVLMGIMNGRNILVSDQIYSTGSGKNRTTHEKTLIGIELREAQLPFMCLYPEGFMDKIFDGFTRYDIDFPHRPGFSQKYVLYGKNENQIRAFFDDRILAFYEQQPAFSTACGGKYLVMWGDSLLNPAQIMAQLNFFFTLANLFLKKY
jgi:hypothetical protein